jgi:hypothetical protein
MLAIERIRRLLAGALGLYVSWVLPTQAQVLDQAASRAWQTGFALVAPDYIGQTYTAGITGGLTALNVALTTGDPTATFTVEVRNVSSGIPGNLILASGTIAAASVSPYLSFTALQITPAVPQVEGTQYAVVVTTSTSGNWWGEGGDPYPVYGRLFHSSDQGATWSEPYPGHDAFFQTFVEPSLRCSGFAAPFDTSILLNRRVNRSVRLELQLFRQGVEVKEGDIYTPPVVSISYASGSAPAIDVTAALDPIGTATDGNQFNYSGTGWTFGLGTKPFSAPGTYTVTVAAGDDSYEITPTCSGQFVRRD